MTGDRRLQRLAVRHLAVGFVAGFVALIKVPNPPGLESILPPSGVRDILMVPLCASALCQAVLLAFWVATSRSSPWRRIAGLISGVVYLEALLLPAFWGDLFGVSTITIAIAVGVLLLMRMRGVTLIRQDDSDPSARAAPPGLRFSIRGVMLTTAVVALLSALARYLQDFPHHQPLLVAFWAVCFITLGLVALWAALGDARPLSRGPVVFVLSPVLGYCSALAAGAHIAGRFYITLAMLLYAALLFRSLLVVRSRGYRLVRQPVPGRDPAGGLIPEGDTT
jgi:hypothetical protein